MLRQMMSRIKVDSPHIYLVNIIVAVVVVEDIPNPSKTHRPTNKHTHKEKSKEIS